MIKITTTKKTPAFPEFDLIQEGASPEKTKDVKEESDKEQKNKK